MTIGSFLGETKQLMIVLDLKEVTSFLFEEFAYWEAWLESIVLLLVWGDAKSGWKTYELCLLVIREGIFLYVLGPAYSLSFSGR